MKCGSLPADSPSVALTGLPSPSTCHSCICPHRVPQWRPMTCTFQPPGVLSEGPDHAVGRKPVRWVRVSPEAGLLWIPQLTSTPGGHLGEKAPAWFMARSVQNEMGNPGHPLGHPSDLPGRTDTASGQMQLLCPEKGAVARAQAPQD